MRLNPDSKGMTVVLAMMSAMGPISTDLYVPAFPQLAQDLSTIPAHVQWTMSAYLIGFALAQIFYGPLSDKFGRKPVLMAAFATYLIACLAASIAQSIEWLAAARFLQGVGGAGPIIVARAIVRDMYTGARAGQQLATMSSIMGLAPILSPVIGGVLAVQFGWRASFVAMFTIIATLTAIAALYLPETIKTRMAEPFSAGAMMRSFAVVIKNPVWAVYAILAGCGQTGIFTFVSASPFVLQGVYGLTPVQFGIGFSVCSAAFVAGAWISSRMVRARGLDRTIGVGVLLFLAGGVAQFLVLALSIGSVLPVFATEMLFFAGVGFVMPHSVAGMLSPFPERAGAATSLAGFFQFTFSAVVGLIVVASIAGSAMPLAVMNLLLGISACVAFFATVALRARHARLRSGAIR